MKIAIIGAGFSGLATAYYLLKKGASVTLFEKAGKGENTSGSASGLLHPFPGFAARISMFEAPCREKTLELLEAATAFATGPIYDKEPLLRVMLSESQEKRFEYLLQERSDISKALELPRIVRSGSSAYWIHSGITIYSKEYIKALYGLLTSLGALFINQEIKNIEELSCFDHTVLAAGFEAEKLIELPGFQKIKGQALVVNLSESYPSILGKGYLAKTPNSGIYHLGSTYEHDFEKIEIDAKKSILESAKEYLDTDLKIEGVKAGVRLAKRSSYLPFVSRISEKLSIIGAMGSRGLLYHAFCGDLLAQNIMQDQLLDSHFSLA
jgi:glycine/D-amino acid oxidase-like deaminating enzyme